MKRIIFLAISTLLVSCSTTFNGNAHITPQQCEAKCSSWGMSLDGMVAMGEYSDACICTKKSNLSKHPAAVGAGAIGVVMQQQAEQARSHHR